MSHKDWYVIGFILTDIAACVLWVLAYIVYRNNRKDYLNKVLPLAMIFMGLWFVSGFIEKILPHPNNTFTLYTFRWAYAAGIGTATFFLLFALGLYFDGAPSRWATWTMITIGTCCAGLCFSPYVVRSATYRSGALYSRTGSLFPLGIVMILVPSIAGLVLITSKWSRSTGIDRARTSVILYGLVVFIPVFAVSIFVLPAVLGNDLSTSYAFLSGLVPVGFTAYSVIRLRLLDTRIILRKTSVLIIGTVLLSMPIVLLFLLFKAINLSIQAQYVVLLLVFMTIIYFAQDVWKSINRLTSRLFFTELYDEFELLEELSSSLAARSDPRSGLLSALAQVICPLGLESIGILVPPGVINENCWCFECVQTKEGAIESKVDDRGLFIPWLSEVHLTVVTEELLRWPKTTDETALGANMESTGVAGCVPISLSKERIGYILVGEKVARKALSATDIEFLEKTAEHIGLYVDNYALSTKLGFQLEELQKVYGDLHKAFDFKSEIIQVASHEFRTPITVINGFAQTLVANWDGFSDEDKIDYVTSITGASKRLMSLTDKFLNISNLEEGDVNFVKVPTRLSSLVQELCGKLRQEDLERLIIEGNPELHIVSDPKHLQVMLENLVENAFRFSPSDKPVVLRIWSDSSTNYIQVQDFGRGIPLEEREKIFEPFVRLESLSHHSQGMGLGLHIVRLLSARLGIEVEIDCGMHGGTTVTLSFEFE